jgi:hypothetical protein
MWLLTTSHRSKTIFGHSRFPFLVSVGGQTVAIVQFAGPVILQMNIFPRSSPVEVGQSK